jgi:hypothetical protein
VNELIVVVSSQENDSIEYAVGKVLRQSTDGNSLQHKIHLYIQSNSGSWSPAVGKGSKKTFPASSIILVGVHLTPRTNKLVKRDKEKISNVLAQL